MQEALNQVEHLRKQLQALLPMKPDYQQKLDKKIRLEFNYNSNHIEGNTLTYGETKLLLIFGETIGSHDKREQDEMEAHDVAYEKIIEWAQDKERPLTETAIKNLNEIILVKPFWKDAKTPDGKPTRRLIKIGNYKESPNSVELPNKQIFEYASPLETPILMGQLIEWYRSEEEKKELHPVALAALLHYRFVRIHPFDDGNGRISRLLVNYVLLKNNLPPIIIKSAKKKEYLHALHQADAGFIDEFIDYIEEHVKWSLELYIKAANGENIEDAEDIDKEIALWKKRKLSTKTPSTKRNDELICQLYRKNIKELFIEFENKHKQFDELFHKKNTFYFLNTSTGSQKWLDDRIEEIENNLQPYTIFDIEKKETKIIKPSPEDSIGKISLMIGLQDYLFDDKNPFSIDSSLAFDFLPYKYVIAHSRNIIMEKKYSEFLNDNEYHNIINVAIRSIFDRIKTEDNQNP